MADWMNMFPSSTDVETSTTAPITRSINDLDIRNEFDSLVLGQAGETPIGQTFIFRRMRRDDDGEMTRCVCVDTVTLEPDRDFPCPYCYGTGFLFDEELITGYKVIAAAPGGSNAAANLPKTEVGHMYVPAIRFFLSYDAGPTRNDRIIEVEMDAAGDAVQPYSRLAIYEFQLVRAMRGDNGKIEFWVCSGQRLGPETLGAVG